MPEPMGFFTDTTVCIGCKACEVDRKSTRLNSSHSQISYAVFCLKKKKKYNLVLDPIAVDELNRIGPSDIYRVNGHAYMAVAPDTSRAVAHWPAFWIVAVPDRQD